MFQALGKVVSRGWPVWLAGWMILFGITWSVAPAWSDVALDQEFAFLPADMPSRQAKEIFKKAFPDSLGDSNIVLVVSRDRPLQPTDRQFIENVLRAGILQIANEGGGLASETSDTEPIDPFSTEPVPVRKKSIIARLQTPETPGMGALLVSQDGQAALVVAELTTDLMARANWPIIERIEQLLRDNQQQGQVPEGLRVQLTGSAVVGRDRAAAELQSVRATGFWTVALIVALLIVIYRAPFLALIPLLTVFLAVQLSLNVLAILAERHYLTVFSGLEVYITVLAYGAGVDYCLFLMARYKEELDTCLNPGDAVARALAQVGPALAASALTVICGIGMMSFARFGKFHEAGFAMPLGIFAVFAATLTFSAPLLRLAGRWAFWPRPDWRGCEPGEVPPPPDRLQRWWQRGAELLRRRPGTMWLTAFLAMAPFAALALVAAHLNYDWLEDLPSSAPSVAGTRTMTSHFPAGLTGSTNILLVNANARFDRDKGRALVEQLTAALIERRQQLGIADLRTLTKPLGTSGLGEKSLEKLGLSNQAIQEGLREQGREKFTANLGGRDRIATRLVVYFDFSPFSTKAVAALKQLEGTLPELLPDDLRAGTQLYYKGATAGTLDLQKVTGGDQLHIDSLVLGSVFVILLLAIRHFAISCYLILSVLLSYGTALGLAIVAFWAVDPRNYHGLDWKVSMFLFTILIAIGEDYNIMLMARVREEQHRHGRVRGIVDALARTGPIISSCGIIMAGTFASLMFGSLREMKQLGVALALGVLLDTFVVRPILVPAFLVMFYGKQITDLRSPPAFAPGSACSVP